MTHLTTEHNEIIINKLATITARTAEITEKLAAMEKPSSAAVEKSTSMFDFIISGELIKMGEAQKKAWMTEFEKSEDTLSYNALEIELKNLEQTLSKKELLCHCPCTYVLTDGELLSPAGFHPRDRVYLANAIMVHSNTEPTKAVGNATRVFNIDKILI